MLKRLVAAVVAALTLLTLSAQNASALWQTNHRALSPTATWAAARTKGVWLYGDSITHADHKELGKALRARGVPLAVDATSGIPVAPTVTRLQAQIRKSGAPRVLVMAVGTNNVARSIYPHQGVPADIEKVMAMVPKTTKVYWVTVYRDPHFTHSARAAADVKAVNGYIAAADRRHRNLTRIGWYATASTNPKRYLYDGTHTTAAGRAARNALILKSVL